MTNDTLILRSFIAFAVLAMAATTISSQETYAVNPKIIHYPPLAKTPFASSQQQGFAVLQNSVIGAWDEISTAINGTITYYPNGTIQETILKEIHPPVGTPVGTYRSVSGTWTLKGNILTQCFIFCYNSTISGDANNLTLRDGAIFHLHRHASF